MRKFNRIRLRISGIVKLHSTITLKRIILLFGFPLLLGMDASAQDTFIARTYPVNHASVRRLEPIIRPLLSPGGSLSVDERTNCLVVRDTESCISNVGETVSMLDVKMPSHSFVLNYADPVRVAAQIQRVFDMQAGVVEPDPRTHTIYVVSTPSNLERIESLIAGWDKPSRQVLIEADILDVSTGKLKELGIDWELRLGYDGGDHDAVFNVNTKRAPSKEPATGTISIGTPTVTIPAVVDAAGNIIAPAQVIPGSDFSATIEALIDDSSTRTLSRPRILALDGQAARFEVSTLEPYANTRYNDHGAATSLDIQFLDVGIILETIPHINDQGYILMEVQPEISRLAREETFTTTIIPNEGGIITNTIRVPVKAQNRAKTIVMVRDNQTIVIGGLRTHDSTESIRKVPILGDIPILGIPFRNLNQSDDKRELIIFITPHITSGGVSSPEAVQMRGELSEKQEQLKD